MNPPIPVSTGEKVAFFCPFTGRLLAALVDKVTRQRVSLRTRDGSIYAIYREDIVGVSPRCKAKMSTGESDNSKLQCMRGNEHKGKHFSHAHWGSVQWTDRKKKG